jgi:DNA repair exonuclease SbcCD nuclease subunit
MKNLFKTAAVFTDLHLGLKHNSHVHLDDCERFIDWFIAEAKSRGAETCIFMGDYHHHRAAINIRTLDYSIRLSKKLNDAFEKVYFITGNHDLYFKDQRSVNSVEYARDLSNFVMVDQPLVQDDVAIIPWLVGDEYKKVIKYKVKYLFGHLELPYFKMNAMVEMPDHGGLSATQLSEPDYVFSGHFHKRQHKGNVHYIGNAFPHNYADAGDTDRGAMFLTWGQEPVYVNWTECPKYQVFTLKDLLDNHETLLDKYTHARVKLDISISYEEATFIKENFVNLYGVRELQLIPVKEEEQYDGAEIKFESVDQIVLQQLDTLESNTIDKSILISIYNELEI